MLGQAAPRGAQHFRYVDPAQLALPFPYYSLIRQPWRSYLEATPVATYLNGLGVVWGGPVPGKSDAQVAAELAWAGFRRVRMEFPWSALRWDESGTQPQFAAQLTELLGALKANGLRPLILLNANHSAPCPLERSAWHLASAARIGDRQVRVDRAPIGIVPMFSMVSTLATSERAGPLVTGVSGDGVLTLSRPLTRDLQANAAIQLERLKYQPLYPVGTREFENTATGWLTYVAYVIHVVRQAYGEDFDLEMWNELSFGSDFLDVNHYFEHPLTAATGDFLHAGGSAWELARRTAEEVRQLDSAANLIWGFSNTTFFHTAVADLPHGFSGQSYHPYGVGPRCYARLIVGRERYNTDGFVPGGCATMPEGWAHTFQQTETLIRLLNPAARAAHPPGLEHFEHYMTEHGLSPAELGIHDPAQALRAKEKFLLRAPLFWLNKGMSALYVYNSFDAADDHFGVLQRDGDVSPAMGALHRLVSRLGTAGAAPAAPGLLDASVEQLTGGSSVYPNDPDGRYVTRRQLVAVLPFARTPGRFAIAVYAMTENFPQDVDPQRYRITLRGVDGRKATVTCYDPLTDTSPAITVDGRSGGQLSIDVELTDAPRLLEVDT
jgi:hypothetical protein